MAEVEKIFHFLFDEATPQRLDKFLVACLPDFSRSRLQALIDEGFVQVEGVLPRKSGQLLESGAVVLVRLPEPAPTHLIPESILGTFFGIDPFLAVAIMAVSVAFYASVGGFRAVVWTDVLQYILLAGLAVYVAGLTMDLSADRGISLLSAASAMTFRFSSGVPGATLCPSIIT